MAETREQMLERARILYLTESDPGGLNFLLKNKMGLSGGAIVALKTRWETESGYKKRLAGAGYGRGAEVAPPPRKPGIFSRIFGRKDDISSKEAEKIAGELYALKMKSMAKNAPKALPPPVDVKQLFFEGKRAEAGKIMMQRGMSGKEIEDSFGAWSKEGPSASGPAMTGTFRALPPGGGPGLNPEAFRNVIRNRDIASAAADAVGTGAVAAGRYVSTAADSTKQGGLRPTMQQIRAPLYGRVQDRGDINRMKGMDPNLRSAINKGRRELQKRAKIVWEEKYKKRLDETSDKFSKVADLLRKDEEELKRVTDILKKYIGDSKPPVDTGAEKSAEAADAEMGTD